MASFKRQITVRLTSDDFEAFRRVAAKLGMTVSTYLRVAALRGLRMETDLTIM